jgi:peroxiredoxin
MTNLEHLPEGLTPPVDDGAAHHLVGLRLPRIVLPATKGPAPDLAGLSGWSVLYCYPMTGRPGAPLPGGWNDIPGARGCTPQACSFRDHFAELRALGVRSVFGISTQTTAYQREAAERLHLPFALLSDAAGELADLLDLPTFEVDGERLLKRLTMIAHDGMIEGVLYPVFPPDRSADDVVQWFAARRRRGLD